MSKKSPKIEKKINNSNLVTLKISQIVDKKKVYLFLIRFIEENLLIIREEDYDLYLRMIDYLKNRITEEQLIHIDNFFSRIIKSKNKFSNSPNRETLQEFIEIVDMTEKISNLYFDFRIKNGLVLKQEIDILLKNTPPYKKTRTSHIKIIDDKELD